MTEHEASRTLVKSPPELWAECSDSTALKRHLGEFGEIRITRLEPETAVAWEGQRASGTVRLEPAGWGTRVTLTAREVNGSGPTVEAIAVEEPEPGMTYQAAEPAASDAVPVENADPVVDAADPETTEPAAEPARPRFLARLRAAMRRKPPGPAPPSDVPVEVAVVEPEAPAVPVEVAVVEPEAPAVPEAAAEAPATDPPPSPHPEAVLTAALDSLGQAHHRPFSRA